MTDLPSGTVTFLFTDIEGSTARWEQHPEAMRVALARHDALIRSAIVRHNGSVVKTIGDAFHAAFARPAEALAAALEAQRRLQAEPWDDIGTLRVRMGLHTGTAEERDGDYYGPTVNRAARLADVGHGGQVLLSQATYELVGHPPPDGTIVRALGEYRLKDLVHPERIYQLVVPGLPSRFPPLRTLDARPNNLPIHPTALLGRERQVADACALLQEGARCVTLTGPGGTGKTRLGLQIAAELLHEYEHGVFFVELASISDPELVPSVIAQALGVRDLGARSVPDLLREYLSGRVVLLVLDNFEQILPSASLVADLLAVSPGLKVLVTSREPLRLRGEQEYPVPPLALPDTRQPITPESVARSSAVALFVQRAMAIRPDFVVSAEHAPAIAEICSRLDGLPLAIELAAARVRMLTPQEMARRLERRLPLLVGGARDLPTRQQTLRDTIAWSHDLLDGQERRLLRRLAVFVGTWTLDAAEVVCNADGDLDVLGSLESLVSKSLVKQSEDERGVSRFSMLETIREYGLEQLEARGEADLTRSRHAAYFLALAEEAAPKLLDRGQLAWLRRLDAAHDDFRAVLRWSLDPQTDDTVGLRLVGALGWFWFLRGFAAEGNGWVTAVLALPGAAAPTVARAQALHAASVMANMQDDYAAEREYGRASVAIFQAHGNLQGAGRSLTEQAIADMNEARDDVAQALLDTSVALARESGDRWGLCFSLSQLGGVARSTGRYAEARARLTESAAIARELGDRFLLGLALAGLARVLRLQGNEQESAATFNEQESAATFKESLVVSTELEDAMLMPRALAGLAGAAVLAARYERAAMLLAAAAAVREASGRSEMATLLAVNDQDATDTRAALGDEAFAAAWAVGWAMSPEQAIAYALEEPPLMPPIRA
jgi:predicted ATPase/class 3 adenylate cyclase